MSNYEKNRKKLLKAEGIQRHKMQQHGTKTAITCPYHIEKTPSLSIDMDKGRFHCFSCRAKGTLDELIEKIEHPEL